MAKKTEPIITEITATVNVQNAAAGSTTKGIEMHADRDIHVHLSKPPAVIYSPPPIPSQNELSGPGPLPPGYRLHLSRNEHFTGRVKDLLSLWTLLKPADQGDGMCAIAIGGIGGTGKTQLAVEFCHRYGQFFHGVHWLAADQNMENEIAACGFAMKLENWPDKLEFQVRDTLHAWQGEGRRLIVMDNLDDENVNREWMPKFGHANVIITTRKLDWPDGDGVRLIRLDVLDRKESLDLLRKLAPRLIKLTDSDLDMLANRLGDLPLALDLAGRFFKDNPDLSPSDYLTELDECQNSLDHTSLNDWVKSNPTRHATSLAATFMLSWNKLTRIEDTQARALFKCCGYCAPNTVIPVGLLETSQQAETRSEKRQIGQSLRRLFDLGLLEYKESDSSSLTPIIHPLIAEFSRSLDIDQSGLEAMAIALQVHARAAYKSKLSANFSPIRPHLEWTAPIAEEAGLEEAGWLWNSLGRHSRMLGAFGQAKTEYQRGLKFFEKVKGSDDPDVAAISNNLGNVLLDLGNLQEAKRVLRKSLEILETIYGNMHPQIVTQCNNLGLVYLELDEWVQAREMIERALAIAKQTGNIDPAQIAIYANNLGQVLQSMGVATGTTGQLEEARDLYQQALVVGEQTLEPEHPIIAMRCNNLGSVLIELGDLETAVKLIKRALAIDEKLNGPNHYTVATRCNNLGKALLKMGRLDEAQAYLERALAISRVVYGDNHLEMAMNHKNMGLILQAKGDLPGALREFALTLKIRQQFLPEESVKVKESREKVAELEKLIANEKPDTSIS